MLGSRHVLKPSVLSGAMRTGSRSRPEAVKGALNHNLTLNLNLNPLLAIACGVSISNRATSRLAHIRRTKGAVPERDASYRLKLRLRNKIRIRNSLAVHGYAYGPRNVETAVVLPQRIKVFSPLVAGGSVVLGKRAATAAERPLIKSNRSAIFCFMRRGHTHGGGKPPSLAGCSAAWLARLTGGQKVAGSNPVTPT